jgi:predicted  nucleic acid-binding Zn-ribbon protein
MMWRQLLNFIAAALTLARDLEQTRADIHRLNEQMHDLALVVERLQGQIIALAQREQAEREKLDLQFQLKQKQFPPSPPET